MTEYRSTRPMTDTTREALLDMMTRTKSIIRSDKPLTLSSGRRSNTYVDLRRLMADPAGACMAASAVHRIVLGDVPHARSIGGMATGAVALATAVSMHSWLGSLMDSNVPTVTSFYVRKPKGHGMGREIEGIARGPAVVVDDVVTSGKSILGAHEAITRAGIECRHAACLVFRGTDADRERIESGLRFEAVLTEDDLPDA
ncbi:MAG: hypothetical protein MPK75_00230 [Alphaproteobacteria bacterium]|nr:hypothetical protein [Alphaproteobacteria bacterium]